MLYQLSYDRHKELIVIGKTHQKGNELFDPEPSRDDVLGQKA